MAQHNESGRAAEDFVAAWLISRKFKILKQNFSTKNFEIDIIASQKKLFKKPNLYIFEVKFRNSEYSGSGALSINQAKIEKLRLAADFLANLDINYGEIAVMGVEVTQSSVGFKISGVYEIEFDN